MINGSAITQLRDSIYLVDVVARAESSERSSVEALRNLQITTPTGASVPLRELAQFQYDLDEGYVWRRGRLPTITVQAEPLPGLQPAFVNQQIAGAIEELSKSMPAGTLIETGGTVEKSEQSNAALIAQFPLMITLMLTALIVQLGSFRQMAMVISVAPLGLIGVVTALLTTSTPMGFIAILGIIALAGMIIRNSVILVDQIEHERARGIDPWNAVIDATMHRFRPIMLTAAAAILGMIPIMHDVFWGPMAYAIVGGLAVATVLTLVFLPALYVAVNGIRQKAEPTAAPSRMCSRCRCSHHSTERETAMPEISPLSLTAFFDRMPRCTPDQVRPRATMPTRCCLPRCRKRNPWCAPTTPRLRSSASATSSRLTWCCISAIFCRRVRPRPAVLRSGLGHCHHADPAVRASALSEPDTRGKGAPRENVPWF